MSNNPKEVKAKEAPDEEEEEEEIEDPQERLRETCAETHHCKPLAERLQVCNDRVSSRTNTAEVCWEELADFMHCADHCVAQSLFKHLK